ncbi:GNAT family N-acetyltransferase [Candidatus Micrarchaeota archaeon]|nr:GNAT family N-acetyltransferase [Candidatus Micrarchaeota archaeon]
MQEQGRRPRLGQVKKNLKEFEEKVKLRDGEIINFRNVLLHPDFISRSSKQWGKFTALQRRNLMQSLSPQKKLERNLLAQTLRSWKKDFPAEERQEFAAWKGSFGQNRGGRKSSDYHFIAAYKGNQAKPELVGYATMQASIQRKDLPTPIALAEYAAVRKDYREKGIYDLLFQKRQELAKASGSKYIVAEVDPFNSSALKKWQSLKSSTKELSLDQQKELAELSLKRNRLLVFNKYYKHIQMPYLDPSEHVNFPGNSRGILNRSAKLNPLWILAHDLQGNTRQHITREEGLKILKSIYRGPQAIRRSDADYVVRQIAGKLPSKIKLKQPKDYT